ncbi:MAG: hypothetical protein II039_08095, partial [Treponema sp.]|nr:hypothetical protein [Treponema sp.]
KRVAVVGELVEPPGNGAERRNPGKRDKMLRSLTGHGVPGTVKNKNALRIVLKSLKKLPFSRLPYKNSMV